MRYSILVVILLSLIYARCSSGTENSQEEYDTEPELSELNEIQTQGLGLYKSYCVSCHGNDGNLALSGAADLSNSELSMDSIRSVITEGRNMMVPFKEVLDESQIEAVAAYVVTLRNSR